MRRFALVTVALILAAAASAPATGAQTLREVTVDFTDAGAGDLPADFYNPLGLVLDADRSVSTVSGDEAVQGPLSGTFNAPVTALAVDVAPAFEGFTNVVATGRITLRALDSSGEVIATSSVEPTTDTAAGTGLDYVTITLGPLPRPATSFEITGGGLDVQAPDYGISCTSTDASCIYLFATSEIRFTIEQSTVDTIAPLISVPDLVRANATSDRGARVSYTVRITDNADPTPTLACEPRSGATFRVGTTVVTCTGRDDSGNSAIATFEISVNPFPDPSKDSVVGFGSILGAQDFNVFVEADPDGDNPTGTASGSRFYNFSARPVCLNVVNNRAAVGFELTEGFQTLGRGLLIFYVDNGDGEAADQILSFSFSPDPPASCPEPPTSAEFPYFVEGDINVHDAPSLPTTKQQCKNGGWRTYGVFKNQGDCVSFVATGGKNLPGNP